jgi:transcriptional regulator of nitric oxide reductase/ferredoxin
MSRCSCYIIPFLALLLFHQVAIQVAMADGEIDPVQAGLGFFDGATNVGPAEGNPPSRRVFAGEEVVGYLLSSWEVVQSTGYSRKPIDILIGLDLDARIAGTVLVSHHEPILIIGVKDADLEAFVDAFKDHDVREPILVTKRGREAGAIDAVSGATVSSRVIADSILRAGRAVAIIRGILSGAGGNLDFESFERASWSQLVEEGSLASRALTVGEVTAAFAAKDGYYFPPSVTPPDESKKFNALFAGLATPARVGRSLFGEKFFNRIMAELGTADQLIFVAGSGLYSFKGTAYRRDAVFDRIRIRQGERAISLKADRYEQIEYLPIEGVPTFREMALFVVPTAEEFDPAQPWNLELTVTGRGIGGEALGLVFETEYVLPERYRLAESAIEPEPLWRFVWEEKAWEVVTLVIILTALTGVLVFQDSVARRRKVYRVVRIGFLVITLGWIGWYAGAQLSVVNVLTFAESIMTDFRWEFFLIEPLIFVLWGYVAVVLLFWGRGVFCGWACPFGALQELTNRLARIANVPQWRLPFGLHERLWPIKYVVFLALFALFLQDQVLTIRAAEVEPFKTAIVLTFDRAWPFIVYALILLVAGLFVNRAFCRYLCPLGAALALPARNRMFEWLKRRWQCGSPCQQCAQACPVQAIHPDGKINPNECVNCLQCQVYYFDDTVCPPLIERRKRREKRNADRLAREEGRVPI